MCEGNNCVNYNNTKNEAPQQDFYCAIKSSEDEHRV